MVFWRAVTLALLLLRFGAHVGASRVMMTATGADFSKMSDFQPDHLHEEGVRPDGGVRSSRRSFADHAAHRAVIDEDALVFDGNATKGASTALLLAPAAPSRVGLLETAINSRPTKFPGLPAHVSFFGVQIIPVPPWLYMSAGLALAALLCCCFCMQGKDRISKAKHKKPRQQYVFDGRVVYEWDQTRSHITMYVTPPGQLTMKNIEVVVWSDHIYIGRKGKPPFLEQELFALIDEKSSSWNKSSRRGELEICMRKLEPEEWPGVILGHIEESQLHGHPRSARHTAPPPPASAHSPLDRLKLQVPLGRLKSHSPRDKLQRKTENSQPERKHERHPIKAWTKNDSSGGSQVSR